MLKSAPKAVDIQDLQFKLHCKLKVFDNPNGAGFSQHFSLVTCASRFGLIFVGTNSPDIQAIQLKDIENYEKADGDKSDYPRRNLTLPSIPTHLSVNCEHTILAIIVIKDNTPWVLFYDVKSFYQQEITKIAEVRLSPTPGVTITEINWNPALAPIFTACKSDGTLGIYELKNSGVDINELPSAAGATCFCWSPKGKQIAVGSRDGKITQLKPDLKAVKVINAPPLSVLHSLQSLLWVSNYEFIGVFQPLNPDSTATFIVINAPKTGDLTYTNYDDICFSNGSARASQFYLILLPTWNILMAASANSMEIGILGNSNESWTQWITGDAARAELPLSANHQETLPIGCALDSGRTQPLPWGESTLPLVPFLLLFSHHGTLCCFNVVNLKEGIPNICTPPDQIKDTSGLQQFISPKNEQKLNLTISTKEPNKTTQIITQAPKTEFPKNFQTLINVPTVGPNVFKSLPQISISTQGPHLPKSRSVDSFGDQSVITSVTRSIKTQPALSGSQYQTLFQAPSDSNTKTSVTPSFQYSSSSSTSSIGVPSTSTPATNLVINNITKCSQPEPKEDLNKEEASTIDLKTEQETENIFAQMIREECLYLESELKAVLHQGQNLKVDLGSDDEKTRLIENTRDLDDFFNEVLEICVSQNAEVHTLKQNLLQSWAWYEEAKSRHLSSQDEYRMILLRAQPLDSASEKQLADIQHTIYYLESQISQAHLALDEQWENFQDYCKKTHKVQIPTMEVIFQTMVKQNAILRKQSYVLKDIASRIKHKSRSAIGPSLLISMDTVKDLPDELKRLRMNPEDICQIQYKHVANKMKKFTKKKVDSLVSFLADREYSHVSVIKPQSTTSIIQTSPFSKSKMFLTPKTPVSTESAKKLDFYQSTPILTTKVEAATSSAPIEGLQSFALNFEAKHFSNLNDKTFVPLTKNLIAGSPNSAFVSTTFGSNTSTATIAPSTIKPSFMGITSAAASTSVLTKTVPSYVAATTVPDANQPILTISSSNVGKPFSFGASLSTTTATPMSSLEKSVSSSSIFGANPKAVTSVLNITSKPTSTLGTGFSLTTTTKPSVSITSPNNSLAKTPTSGVIFASTTAPTSTSFSFNSGATSSIFGATNQKSSESTGTAKPFVFLSKATTASTTTVLNLSASKPAVGTTAATPTIQLGVTATSVSTSKTASVTPSVFATTAGTSKPLSTTTNISSSTSIFLLNQHNSAATTGAATVTNTSQPVFSLGGPKPSLFTAMSSLVSSISTAATSSTISAGGITSTVSSFVSTGAVSPITTTVATTTKIIFGSKTATTKPSTFESPTSALNSTSFTVSAPTSTTGFSFASTSSSKPVAFGGTEGNTTKPSIFGNVTTTTSTTSASLSFGAVAPTTSQSSIFGTSASTVATSTPVFGSPTVTTNQSSVFGTVASTSNVFGSSTIQTQSSIFGSAPSVSTTFGTLAVSSAQPSIFGATSSTSAAFGSLSTSSTQPSVFTTTPSPSTTFGIATTAQPSIFGAVSTTTSTSVFGTPATTSNSLFGATTKVSSPPLFGAGAIASSTAPIFGSSTANKSSVFGSTPTTTVQSIFGNTTATTTTQSQGFGMFGDTSQKTSVFGTTPNTTQSPIFGGNSQSSVFGTAASTSGSVFGQSQPSSTFGQSVFGSSRSTFGTSSVFGSPAATFGPSSGSIFGNAPTTSGSIFGGATSPSTGSVFGTPASNASSPFGSGNVFASNTTQTSVFGTNTNTGSFGFGSLNVGSTATTSSSGFGSSPAANPFGGENKNVFGSPAPSSSSIFGSSSTSPFGSSSQTFGGGFGSQSPFGQSSTFGHQGSFGNSTFGQAAPGPFSGGSTGGVAQTGFGTNSNFQKPGGFGSSPVFGGSPSFGSAPSFGGAPAFGTPPAFNSTSKAFGGATAGFGSAVNTQSTGFGNLANQPTVGFGNLAEQAATASPSTPFSGNSSFSSWR